MDISYNTDGDRYSYDVYLSGEEASILRDKGSLNGELDFFGNYCFNANIGVGFPKFSISGVDRPMPSVFQNADRDIVAKFVMSNSAVEELLKEHSITSRLATGDVTIRITD